MEDGKLIKFAESLADQADKMACIAFESARKVQRKADKSLVTETDKAIESALTENIRAHYPDHGVFGEEHGRINESAEYQWVIDPIDGTSAFVAGIPTFTTLIALCKDSIPILGIISQPILKERWISTTQTSSSNNASLPNAFIATTSLAYFNEADITSFLRLRDACGSAVYGGDAYLYARLASGNIDIVCEAGLKPYDFCALSPVVHASGGVMTDWEGTPLTIHSDGRVLASANADLHQRALAILQTK